MVRVLIVGGQGFIGTHILNKAIKLGWDVTSLNLSQKHSCEINKSVKNLTADISNKSSLRKALKTKEYEYIINASGYINHKYFLKGDGQKLIDTHFKGVLNLVEVLNHGVVKSFVNIGSSDEYGISEAPQEESMRESPISPYSLAKVAAAHFLQMLYRTEGFPATTLRLFLAYGPGQDQKRFLPQVIRGCLSNRSFPVSEGRQLRDFCYIEDIVDAVFRTLHSPQASGEIINIGSGIPISIKQVIEDIKNITGAGKPNFGEVLYRKSENMALYANNKKAKKILKWSPKTSLKEGLIKTIDWYKEHYE